jgi:CRISPR/Cas system CSM-associated protein Csm3 (group 7 of RAMP superfamily)
MSDETRPWLRFEVARVTIEMSSPFLVGSGEGDGLHDEVFTTDANGLPAIPGESLTGVLRHALAEGRDPANDEACREVFGFQDGDRGDASAVKVSWAQVHGKSDRPVPFRGADVAGDEVLALLAAGVPRDHVRIGPHGAVDERGKFDELLVPAGARFTFELVVDERSPRRAEALLSLLARRELRIGKATRRGHGRLKIIRAAVASFDLRDPDDRASYARLPVALEDGDGGVLAPMALPESGSGEGWVTGTMTLEAEGSWLIGGTLPARRQQPRRRGEDKGKPGWDRFPFTERHIEWKEGPAAGVIVHKDRVPFVVPASSVKGALRHRTAFHSRALRGLWAERGEVSLDEGTEDERALFGELRSDEGGRPGRLILDDARVFPGKDVDFAAFQHVCLDRFTQGPMDGLLFDELAVHGGRFEMDISLRTVGLEPEARCALAKALDDLCEGRLGLGAGRSHGRFQGSIRWDDDGAWKEQGA